MYGVTLTGFNKRDFNNLLVLIQDAFKAGFGNSIDLSGESPAGILANLMALIASLSWDGLEGVYNSEYQEFAEGVPLDNAMALTSNTRLDELKSNVVQTIVGTVGFVVDAGFRMAVDGDPTTIFETTAQLTIPAGGTIDVNMVATEFGAKIALAGTLTDIITPLSGVTSGTNANDAIVGRDNETDANFKLSAKNQKQKSGTSPIEGIRGAILDLDNIVQAIVNENDDDIIVGGLEPHSIEAVVQGGDEDEIAEAIFLSKAGGIQTNGSISKVVTDSQGINHTIKFNTPTDKRVYVIVNITKNTDPLEGALYPADGDDQIKASIVSWGSAFAIGRDVLKDGASGIINPINEIAGIREVVVYFALTPAPAVNVPIVIANNELASFASGDITVNS